MTSGMPNLNLMFGQKLSDIKAGKFDEDTTEDETSTETTTESSAHDKAIAQRSLSYGNKILSGCYGQSSPINNLFNSGSNYSEESNTSYSSPSLGEIFNNNLFNSYGNISINEENFMDWLNSFFKSEMA